MILYNDTKNNIVYKNVYDVIYNIERIKCKYIQIENFTREDKLNVTLYIRSTSKWKWFKLWYKQYRNHKNNRWYIWSFNIIVINLMKYLLQLNCFHINYFPNGNVNTNKENCIKYYDNYNVISISCYIDFGMKISYLSIKKYNYNKIKKLFLSNQFRNWFIFQFIFLN